MTRRRSATCPAPAAWGSTGRALSSWTQWVSGAPSSTRSCNSSAAGCEKRPISGNFAHYFELAYRHDIPGSDIAYGIEGSNYRQSTRIFLTEVNENWEGPWFVDAYLEHKDVFGLTVRATVGNVLNARHRVERDIYDGRRLRDPLLYRQSHDQLIGPIFSLLVKGTF